MKVQDKWYAQNKIDTEIPIIMEVIKDSSAEDLRNLFINELKDIYWAEKALLKAIPKMIKNATSPELVEALSGHMVLTNEHVNRILEVFLAINKRAIAKKCEAIEGLLKEAGVIMIETGKGLTRDEGIIMACQKIIHYEIATYGTLCSFARTLGDNEAAILMQKTLDQEYEMDEELTKIAETLQSELIKTKQ